MTKYLDRATATTYIREKGLRMGDNQLADLAYEERGPRFAIVNARAVYTTEWIDEWIEAEVARSVKRHRASKPGGPVKRHRASKPGGPVKRRPSTRTATRPAKRRRSSQSATAP